MSHQCFFNCSDCHPVPHWKTSGLFVEQIPLVLTLLLAWLCADIARAEDSPNWTLPVVGVGETATEHIASVVANRPQRKLYVGVLSRDAARRGLWVYDLGDDGQPVAKPRKYSDHPDELPAGHHSTPVCILLDAVHRKLFLGVSGSHPTHARSLVMYELDERGEPSGKPVAFDHGNPNKSCDALALHPTSSRMYAVGWGGEGVFILDRDEQGRPTGKPAWRKFGGYGGYAVAISADGKKLYRGTYPSVLEVCDLDTDGNVSGTARAHAISNGPKEYLRFAATNRAVYIRGPDKRLAWFRLDATGAVVGEMQTADIAGVQAIASATRADRLLIATASGFDDAITGKPIINGVEVREVALKADGTPGDVVQKTKPFVRAEAISLSGGATAALAAKSLGRGFLGNRIAGLKTRVTLVSLEPNGTPLPAAQAVSFGKQDGYLRFAVSAKYATVYAAVGDMLSAFTPDKSATVNIKMNEVAGPIAVDDVRDRLLVALKDGTIAVRQLDEKGKLIDKGESLQNSLANVGALAVHPTKGLVYAIGQPNGKTIDTPGVVPVPAGYHARDAVIDAQSGRLYVVGAYHGQANTSMWKLDDDGRLSDDEPQWLPDSFPFDKAQTRGVLSSVRVDSERRKLYVCGAQENNMTQPGWLIVRDLDERGDPTGKPRLYASSNSRGSCEAIELSSDGHWLYEAGWGDPRVFVRRLDKRGEPLRDSTAWNVGTFGKRQLGLLRFNKRDRLLAGTHPSELEVIPLRAPSEPEPGAMVDVAVGPVNEKLGMMSVGQSSEWIELDAALKNDTGRAVVRATLGGAPVKRAVVRWEVARQTGERLEPIRTAEVSLIGNVAALVLPKYGIDDATDISARITTSAEEFARYRDIARRYAVSPSEGPQRLMVANGLIGIDSSEAALETGMETLALLGHNTAQIWNWPGIAPDAIRASAERHGIRRFRDAVYNPPSYFHYNVDLVQPESLDKWAAGFRDAAARMGAKPKELELLHMGDEPGWYYPRVTDDVRNDPRRLAVFREYLKSKGLSPADVGAASWDTVEPGRLSQTKSLPQRRLFFWTTRFYAESLSLAFAAATEAVERQVNPKILTTTNLNNWPGRFYIPSPSTKIANNTDASPDAGMGMPDWFDLGRKRAVSCIWTEDWFGDRDAQLWSLYGDLLRCAAGGRDIQYGGYPVGQSTGAMSDGAVLKIASLVGHGAKTIDPYIFGPNLAFGDGWSEKEATYRNLGAAMRLIGKADHMLSAGRPRDGTVAIIFPQASQVWDTDAKSKCYQQELYGLHAALIHESFSVDFIDDFALESGELSRRNYVAVYVTAPNLSMKAQKSLIEWVKAGGTLAVLPGACAADHYNEPATTLRSLIGARQPVVRRIAPPHYTQALRIERQPVRVTDARLGTDESFAVVQTAPLTPTTAKSIANFADGSVAATVTALGKGRLIAFGFWPGISYWLSPDRTAYDRLPINWSAAARQVAVWPARTANTPRHVLTNQPGVEACLLESAAGLTITLLNWTGKPIDKLQVTIPTKSAYTHAEAADAGPLKLTRVDNGVQCVLPLRSADIVMITSQ